MVQEINKKKYWFDEEKNKITHLWDELEMILEGDMDFEIQERSNSILKMKAKRMESFNNSLVMGKIFGTIYQ